MASKKYNFKKPLLDLDGSVIIEDGKEVIMSNTLSTHIRNSVLTKELVMKVFAWGVEVTTNGYLILDDEDKKQLRENILDSYLPNVSKGRLVELLDYGGEPIETKKK